MCLIYRWLSRNSLGSHILKYHILFLIIILCCLQKNARVRIFLRVFTLFFFRSLFNLETNSHFFFSSSFCVCVRTSPAELLSQLSGVRRAAGGQINSSGPSASQLQQLQMQLQLERQQAQAARQQVETSRHATRRGNNPGNTGAAVPQPSTATANTTTVGESNPASSSHSSQFLLARWVEQEVDFRVCL